VRQNRSPGAAVFDPLLCCNEWTYPQWQPHKPTEGIDHRPSFERRQRTLGGHLAQQPPHGVVRRNLVREAKMLLQPVLLLLGPKLNFNQRVSSHQQDTNDNHQGFSRTMLDLAAPAGVRKRKENLVEALRTRLSHLCSLEKTGRAKPRGASKQETQKGNSIFMRLPCWRHLIENFFAKLKQYLGLATSYDK